MFSKIILCSLLNTYIKNYWILGCDLIWGFRYESFYWNNNVGNPLKMIGVGEGANKREFNAWTPKNWLVTCSIRVLGICTLRALLQAYWLLLLRLSYLACVFVFAEKNGGVVTDLKSSPVRKPTQRRTITATTTKPAPLRGEFVNPIS